MMQIFQSKAGCENVVIPRRGATLGKCKAFGNKKVSLAAAYAVSWPQECKELFVVRR